jgi:D-alanine-D-alanine ligase-like ATP-grasp enzyme
MKTVFLAAKNQLDRRVGFFDLLGFDIMLDDNMKLWLIEVNVNPALFTNCAVLQSVALFS